MLFLYIILLLLAVIILLFLWIVITPLIIFVDTRSNTYYLKLAGIAKAGLIFPEGLPAIRMRIFMIPFTINPFKPGKTKKKEEKKKERKKQIKKKKPARSSSGSFSSFRKLAGDIFRTFRIKHLYADIDTGDVINNAFLFPAVTFINRENIHITINNTGNNFLEIKIQNRIILILFVFIKYKMRN